MGEQPAGVDRLSDLTIDTLPEFGSEDLDEAFRAQPDRLAEVVEAVGSLRNLWAQHDPAGIAAEVRARADALQAAQPQLGDIHFRVGDSKAWAVTAGAEWIRPSSIVRTTDPVWGEFDRMGPSRRGVWVADRTVELLASGDLKADIRRYFCDAPPVRLNRFSGPAGPLFAVAEGGTHRSHLSRILGLPWMFARTSAVPVPRQLSLASVTDDGDGVRECRDLGRLWAGLLRRGVVHGELDIRGWFGDLRIDYTPATWLLLPADTAAAYSRRYEQLYPGALADAGIPLDAIANSQAWTGWLRET